MTATRSPTALGCAILGLLMMRPQSGYEIARVFADTPMAAFSSSPGAIYPAIKKLAGAGLVEKTSRDPESTKTAFAITQKGRATFRDWLRKPIALDDVEHRLEELTLRFAFMSGNIPDADIKNFLASLKQEIEAHIAALSAYEATAKEHLSPSAALAMEAGIESYRVHARWAARAMDSFSAAETPGMKKAKGRKS